jgi:hypothetical protein
MKTVELSSVKGIKHLPQGGAPAKDIRNPNLVDNISINVYYYTPWIAEKSYNCSNTMAGMKLPKSAPTFNSGIQRYQGVLPFHTQKRISRPAL